LNNNQPTNQGVPFVKLNSNGLPTPVQLSPSNTTNTTKTADEQQEGWEMIDPYSFYNQDISILSNEVPSIATKPDDNKSLESLDTRKAPE
jgi:hypothetical protein